MTESPNYIYTSHVHNPWANTCCGSKPCPVTRHWEAELVPQCQLQRLRLLAWTRKAGELSAHTQVSRDESMEKQIAMEGYGGKRTRKRKEESRRNGQLSQFLGSLQAGGSWSHALLSVGWGGVSLSPSTLSTVAKCSCTSLAEYDFPHISGCNIITFLLANWDLSPSPGTLQIKLFFCISLTWLLMVVWRFVIVRFRLLSSYLRAIVQTL